MLFNTTTLVAFVVLTLLALCAAGAFTLSALGLAWYTAPVAIVAFVAGKLARR